MKKKMYLLLFISLLLGLIVVVLFFLTRIKPIKENSGDFYSFSEQGGIETQINQPVKTFAQIWEAKDQLLESEIAIKAKVVSEGVSCTEMGCPPTNKCCNGCGGGYALVPDNEESYDPDAPYIRLDTKNSGAKIGCSGNSCGVSCSPFIFGKTYSIKGLLKHDKYPLRRSGVDGHYYLEYSGHSI